MKMMVFFGLFDKYHKELRNIFSSSPHYVGFFSSKILILSHPANIRVITPDVVHGMYGG